MATVKGQNLRIFLGNGDSKPIAAALSCELSLQMNVKQYSTKDDETDFANNQVVSLTWSMKAQNVVTDVAYVEALGADDLMGMIGTSVHVQMATTSGDQNREQGRILLAGDAILSDVQITAENRKRGLCEITLTGKKNMLFDLRLIRTSDQHYIRTSDGHLLAAAHEEV